MPRDRSGPHKGDTVRVQQERNGKQATPGSSLAAALGSTVVKAPMPGRVLKTLADAGHAKRAGDVLIVMESMKMQIELRCPQDGVIQDVHIAVDDHVRQGQTLVTLAQSSENELSKRKNGSNGASKQRKDHAISTSITSTAHS